MRILNAFTFSDYSQILSMLFKYKVPLLTALSRNWLLIDDFVSNSDNESLSLGRGLTVASVS